MAHIRCDFRSEALDMGTSMTIVLPENRDMFDVNVVYLLHGLADNCTGWSRYTSVERYARKYEIALVIPEVQRSFYTDMEYGLKYFTFVHDELPQICKKFLDFQISRIKRTLWASLWEDMGLLNVSLQLLNGMQAAALSQRLLILIHEKKRREPKEAVRKWQSSGQRYQSPVISFQYSIQ